MQAEVVALNHTGTGDDRTAGIPADRNIANADGMWLQVSLHALATVGGLPGAECGGKALDPSLQVAIAPPGLSQSYYSPDARSTGCVLRAWRSSWISGMSSRRTETRRAEPCSGIATP